MALYQDFYDAVFHGLPCRWSGCVYLRERRQKELAAMGASCSSCDRDAVDAKFVRLVRQQVKKLIG